MSKAGTTVSVATYAVFSSLVLFKIKDHSGAAATPLVPAFQRQRQKDPWEFQDNWRYIVRPHLQNRNKSNNKKKRKDQRGLERWICC